MKEFRLVSEKRAQRDTAMSQRLFRLSQPMLSTVNNTALKHGLYHSCQLDYRVRLMKERREAVLPELLKGLVNDGGEVNDAGHGCLSAWDRITSGSVQNSMQTSAPSYLCKTPVLNKLGTA